MSPGDPMRSTYYLTTTFELAPQLVGPCWQTKPTSLALATESNFISQIESTVISD